VLVVGSAQRAAREVLKLKGLLGCSIPGYVPGYEGMYPLPEGMLSIPWAQGMVNCIHS